MASMNLAVRPVAGLRTEVAAAQIGAKSLRPVRAGSGKGLESFSCRVARHQQSAASSLAAGS